METYYGQDRKNYHTFRLTDEEEQNFRKLMKKYGYTSISSFIRDAILDRKLTVITYQDPVKYDHTHSIRQLMSNIMTLDKRWIRAETKFEAACRIPGVSPETIHRHANRIRLIVVELVGKMDYLRRLLGESHEMETL